MGFKPEQCIVIEDNPIGIEAALLANINLIYYNPSAFDVPNSVISIKHMRELQSAIKTHPPFLGLFSSKIAKTPKKYKLSIKKL